MSLNKVMLIGNVGNDPEVRYLESNPQNPAANAKVASFRLATTERYRDRSGELRASANADVAEKYIRKGSQLYIEGKLRTRQWTDQTGAKRYTTEVVADTVQLLGKRPEDGTAPIAQPVQAQAPVQVQPQVTVQAPVVSAPVATSAPAQAPVYQGPLPAAEPSDDLPF